MKKIVYLIALMSISVFSQGKYLTKTGEITFEASVAAFEEVKGTSSTATAILNTENGDLAALALVKGFRFKNALMEEHFNENYADSDDFPKTNFRGNIKEFSIDKLTTNASTMSLNGTLTFHGKTKELSDLPLNISIDGDIITISGKFNASPAEFDIKIPKVVQNKITESIEVSFSFELKKR